MFDWAISGFAYPAARLQMASHFDGVKAVLFDAVGTLIHPDPPAVEAYRRAGAEFGAALPLEEVARRLQRAFRTAFADARWAPTDHAAERGKWRQVVAAVFHDTPAPLDLLFERLWEHFAQSDNWALFPDTARAWRELESRGYLLGVASNYDDRLPGVLAGLPPLDCCRRVYWSSRVGYAKPHPAFFAAVERDLALPPQAILLIGDDLENDILAAQAAGWKALYLDRQERGDASPRIASLAQALDLLPA